MAIISPKNAFNSGTQVSATLFLEAAYLFVSLHIKVNSDSGKSS